MGTIFYGEKGYFDVKGEKCFNKEAVVEFCLEKGFALYDTASEVRRLKDNASDKFLEVVTPTDINSLLKQLPSCGALVTTGQKATDIIVSTFGCEEPKVGASVVISTAVGDIRFWRMPSSSRAYPLSLEKKAAFYRAMFLCEGLLLDDK